jgi:glycosyltransferase involved in cell wall biosynthesis
LRIHVKFIILFDIEPCFSAEPSRNPLKIVYFSYLYDIRGVSAGSANKAIGFLSGLRSLGHETVLCWRSPQPEDGQSGSLRRKVRGGMKRIFSRYVHDPKKIAMNIPWFFAELVILRREKPDVLFLRSELYNVSAMLAAKTLGIPVVLEVDCPTAYEHRRMVTLRRAIPPRIPEWFERWNWRECRAIITISDLLKQYMVERGVPARKITVVPNGADPNVFRPRAGAGAVRRRLGIPPDAVILGWIGSLVGWSGLENLLAVSRRILELRRSAVFLFVGGGRNEEAIRGAFRVEDIGKRVFMTGTVPYADVPRFLNPMDVVIVPYPKREFWYPSSMKLFEYMASAKAVVASAVPQVDEVIRDGENGFLFDPEDPGAMTAKILRLVDSPRLRRKLAVNGRSMVLKSYTWTGHAGKMEAVLSETIRAASGEKRFPIEDERFQTEGQRQPISD